MKPKTFATILALLPILATSSCVTYTSMKDEPRLPVRFTSARAAQTFYDAYLAPGNPERKRSVSVFVSMPYSHQKTSSENIRFNAAVRAADRNHDRVISEKEASAYARDAKPAYAM